jgi:hypothetical protein
MDLETGFSPTFIKYYKTTVERWIHDNEDMWENLTSILPYICVNDKFLLIEKFGLPTEIKPLVGLYTSPGKLIFKVLPEPTQDLLDAITEHEDTIAPHVLYLFKRYDVKPSQQSILVAMDNVRREFENGDCEFEDYQKDLEDWARLCADEPKFHSESAM